MRRKPLGHRFHFRLPGGIRKKVGGGAEVVQVGPSVIVQIKETTNVTSVSSSSILFFFLDSTMWRRPAGINELIRLRRSTRHERSAVRLITDGCCCRCFPVIFGCFSPLLLVSLCFEPQKAFFEFIALPSHRYV